MNKVIVTAPVLGVCMMQVCAEKDATDEEILGVCNGENPSGTRHGWTSVIREVEEGCMFRTEKALPVKCSDYPDRRHFLVLC